MFRVWDTKVKWLSWMTKTFFMSEIEKISLVIKMYFFFFFCCSGWILWTVSVMLSPTLMCTFICPRNFFHPQTCQALPLLTNNSAKENTLYILPGYHLLKNIQVLEKTFFYFMFFSIKFSNRWFRESLLPRRLCCKIAYYAIFFFFYLMSYTLLFSACTILNKWESWREF